MNQDLVMVKNHNQELIKAALENYNPMEIEMEVTRLNADGGSRN